MRCWPHTVLPGGSLSSIRSPNPSLALGQHVRPETPQPPVKGSLPAVLNHLGTLLAPQRQAELPQTGAEVSYPGCTPLAGRIAVGGCPTLTANPAGRRDVNCRQSADRLRSARPHSCATFAPLRRQRSPRLCAPASPSTAGLWPRSLAAVSDCTLLLPGPSAPLQAPGRGRACCCRLSFPCRSNK